jgi:hypothetical protein
VQVGHVGKVPHVSSFLGPGAVLARIALASRSSTRRIRRRKNGPANSSSQGTDINNWETGQRR